MQDLTDEYEPLFNTFDLPRSFKQVVARTRVAAIAMLIGPAQETPARAESPPTQAVATLRGKTTRVDS